MTTKPSTDWKEIIPPGEPARLQQLAEQLLVLQKARAAKGGVNRGLHAKGLAGVEGMFTVLPDLPEYARVGLFREPATYRAYVRFSNASGGRRRDNKPDVRGVAVKLLGVSGKKIIPGLENATTQDFLCIHNSVMPVRNAEDFVWLIGAGSKPALLLPRAIRHFGLAGTIRLIGRIVKQFKVRVISLATTRFYSALPIRFGTHAAHYALMPQAISPRDAKPDKSPDFLAQDLASRLSQGPVTFDFRVQFFVDEARTPIEDAAVEWKEEVAPWVTLARLQLPRQEMHAPRGKRVADFIETLSFDPWHAGEDFRPLGNMMRARNAAYRLSTRERRAAPEPDGNESHA